MNRQPHECTVTLIARTQSGSDDNPRVYHHLNPTRVLSNNENNRLEDIRWLSHVVKCCHMLSQIRQPIREQQLSSNDKVIKLIWYVDRQKNKSKVVVMLLMQ